MALRNLDPELPASPFYYSNEILNMRIAYYLIWEEGKVRQTLSHIRIRLQVFNILLNIDIEDLLKNLLFIFEHLYPLYFLFQLELFQRG